MKKLVYLALLSAMAFVVGCNKPAEDTTTAPAATNAAPAAPATK